MGYPIEVRMMGFDIVENSLKCGLDRIFRGCFLDIIKKPFQPSESRVVRFLKVIGDVENTQAQSDFRFLTVSPIPAQTGIQKPNSDSLPFVLC